MPKFVKPCVLAALAGVIVVGGAGTAAVAQSSINGGAMAIRSTGGATGGSWGWTGTGYIGTYITVPEGGADVSFTLNAQHSASGAGSPHMNLVVADTKFSFNLAGTTAANYGGNVFLPGGTYFVRAERDYVAPTLASTRQAIVNSLTVSGATIVNPTTAEPQSVQALAASDTYINNFRRGNANVSLRGPGDIALLPGTQAPLHMTRSAFNFGTAVAGFNGSTFLQNNPTPGSNNDRFQQALKSNFNALVPENAGKWGSNSSGSIPSSNGNISYMNSVLNYAQANNMRSRAHNLIWGSQQPTWVNNHLANSGSFTALRGYISDRIKYYVGDANDGNPNDDPAKLYTEIDVYNESVHTAQYWNAYGAAGVASIYNEVAAAAASVGANNLRLYTNEYNVLADGNDQFANWYSGNISAIRNQASGGAVGGVGVQYYANPTNTALPDNGNNSSHSPRRIMQTMQQLSTQGLPITLTEFGAKPLTTEADAATILNETLRIVYGTPDAAGFFMWGFWKPEMWGGRAGDPNNNGASGAAFYRNDWTTTPALAAWQALMNAWTTPDQNLTVDANGNVAFNGFFGDYALAGGSLTLSKGTSGYNLTLASPPDWYFWKTTNAGNWTAGANWTNGVPNGIGQTAHFGNSPVARTITVDAPITVGMINFDSVAGAYTLDGDATITLHGPAGIAAMNVVGGSHLVSAPVAPLSDVRVNVIAGSMLAVSNLGRNDAIVLAKDGGGILAVNHVRAGALAIGGGTVTVLTNGSEHGASRVGVLALGATAVLDLNDNDLVVTDANYSEIAGAVAFARHGGAWDRAGITSSAARTQVSGATTLGVLNGADYIAVVGNSFDGFTVAPTDILVKYTYYGDTDFNGRVNFDDYARIDTGFTSGGSDWFHGDLNYDGVVNFDDYALIDLAFLSQEGDLNRAVQYLTGGDRSSDGMDSPSLQVVLQHDAQFGDAYGRSLVNAVPEPTSIVSATVLAGIVISTRRRRTAPRGL